MTSEMGYSFILLKFKEEIKAKAIQGILKVQPINNATKISSYDNNHNDSNQKFSHIYNQMIEQSSQRANQESYENESRLCNKVNYYGTDARVTYYSCSISQNNFYS
jgi:hypothetical protein